MSGLPGEHLPATSLARPATQVDSAQRQAADHSTRRRQAGNDVEARYVLPQRKESQVSRGHRQQSNDEGQTGWEGVVRDQVSGAEVFPYWTHVRGLLNTMVKD